MNQLPLVTSCTRIGLPADVTRYDKKSGLGYVKVKQHARLD
jgi:hypothetical protein